MRRLLLGAGAALLLLAHAGVASAAPRAAVGSCVSIAFGSTVAGAINPAGEADCYTFTGATGDRVRVRVDETGALRAVTSIVRPNASVACGPSSATELNCAVNANGTWKIAVTGSSATQTGSYSIALQRTSNPVGCSSVGATALARSIDAA